MSGQQKSIHCSLVGTWNGEFGIEQMNEQMKIERVGLQTMRMIEQQTRRKGPKCFCANQRSSTPLPSTSQLSKSTTLHSDQLLVATLLHHPALVQHHDAVAPLHLVELVRDQERRCALQSC